MLFSFFALFVVSTFLPPLAPRALPRFLATTEALSPSGHGSSGPPSGHERRSFPLVIPDSYRSNFRPFYLHPPHAFLSFCSLCSPEDRSRIFRSPFSERIPFLASPLRSRLANASGRIEFSIVLFMDCSFAFGCSPPRLSTTQLPSATDRPVFLSDEDFHPIVVAYSQAHLPRPFGPRCRRYRRSRRCQRSS